MMMMMMNVAVSANVNEPVDPVLHSHKTKTGSAPPPLDLLPIKRTTADVLDAVPCTASESCRAAKCEMSCISWMLELGCRVPSGGDGRGGALEPVPALQYLLIKRRVKGNTIYITGDFKTNKNNALKAMQD